MKMPLSIVIETAKSKLISSVNEVMAETNLPAYLLEGAILEILADIRNRKAHELLRDSTSMNKSAETEADKAGG